MILIKNIKKSIVNNAGYNPFWFVNSTIPSPIIFSGSQIQIDDSFSGGYAYKNAGRIDCKISGQSRNPVTIYIIASETKIELETNDYRIHENLDITFGNIKVVIYSRNDINDRGMRIFCGTYKNKEIFFKGTETRETTIQTSETPAEFTAANILPLLLKNKIPGDNLVQISSDHYRWGKENIVRWTENMVNFHEYSVDFTGEFLCTERYIDEYRICRSGKCKIIDGEDLTNIQFQSPTEKNYPGDIKISIKDITYKRYRPRFCKQELFLNNSTPNENQIIVEVDTGIYGEFSGDDYEWKEQDIAYIGIDEYHIFQNGGFKIIKYSDKNQIPGNPTLRNYEKKLVNFVFGDTIPVYGSMVKKPTVENFSYYERIIDNEGEEIINYYEPEQLRILRINNFDYRGFKMQNPNIEAFLLVNGFSLHDGYALRDSIDSNPAKLNNLTVLGNKKVRRNSPLDDFVTIGNTMFKTDLFPLELNDILYTYDDTTEAVLITRKVDRNGFYFDLDFEDLKNYSLENLGEIKKGGLLIGVSLIDKNKSGIIQNSKLLYLIQN